MEILSTFILSRHTLRRPLYELIEFSDEIQNENWRDFSNTSFELTEKGIELEKELSKSLKSFLPEKIDNLIIHANSTPRTQETLRIVLENLLNIYDKDIEKYIDKFIFYSKDIPSEKVELDFEIDKLKLEKAKNEIIKFCENRFFYKLKESDDLLNIDLKVKPNGFSTIKGDISKYSKIADIILTEYYDGEKFDMDFLKTISYPKQICLDLISGICPYNLVPIKKLNKIYENTINSNNTLTVLVGHDTTINAFCKIHKIDINKLSSSLEKTPIGGKLVINKLSNNQIKAYYVYFDNLNFQKIIIDELKIN